MLVLAPKLWQLHGSGNWYGEVVFHLCFGTYADSFLLSSDACFIVRVNGLGSLVPIFCVQISGLQRYQLQGSSGGMLGCSLGEPAWGSFLLIMGHQEGPGKPGQASRSWSLFCEWRTLFSTSVKPILLPLLSSRA